MPDKDLSEYLISGEAGIVRIVATAKGDEGSDNRANRVLKLTVQEI